MMLKRLVFLASVAALPLSAAAAEPASEAAKLFGVRESVQNMDISADGTKVVYVAPTQGAGSAAIVLDITTGKAQALITSGGKAESLNWCRFAGSAQVVCKLSGSAFNVERLLLGWTRLLALGLDGAKPRLLGQHASAYDSRVRQFDGEILDILPDEDGAVLMSREYVPEEGKTGSIVVRRDDGVGVDHIDLRTLKSRRVERPVHGASSYISDRHGQIRMMSFADADSDTGTLSGRTTYFYRRKGDQAWLKFSDSKLENPFVPVAVDESTDSAYAHRKLNGRSALYRVKLDGSLTADLVFAHDKVDVEDVIALGGRVVGATYVDDRRKVTYFDPEYQKLQAGLSKAIPNLPLITFVNTSSDGGKVLVLAESDIDPGRYFLLDRKTKRLGELFPTRPGLAGTKLATMKSITYASGDVSIPAYLTLPPGRETAKGLPAIILPHGGPSSRDEWRFDWLAQFLANQGYAVLQPNYRGSAGYGDPWYNKNGFKGWKTSIGDVTAGAKWLIQSGIADPKHVSIVGWSYGGYAALQSAVVEPGMFKAVVAVAPVTDFALLKAEAEHYTNSKVVAAEIGSGPHLREGSPLQNVERLSAPVLMFSGDHDLNVNVEQARKMDKALRAAGKASEFVLFPELDHQIADSDARTQMLAKIAAFLETHGAK
jgi:dipeptidyl aminopeptidase/acylaminoacyl peptidase